MSHASEQTHHKISLGFRGLGNVLPLDFSGIEALHHTNYKYSQGYMVSSTTTFYKFTNVILQ
jgi:hypothetical protein